jgi:type 1 glutamine amidotransferase
MLPHHTGRWLLSRRTFLLAVFPLVLLRSSALAAQGADSPRSVKLLLVGQGPDGHPPQSHEYMAGLKVLARCLERVPGLEITTVRAEGAWKEGPELIARADGVVLFLAEGARWMNHDPKRRAALEKLAARGGGIAVLHWAMGTKDAQNIDPAVKLFGGCHGGPDRKYQVLETGLHVADPRHPVTAGIKDFRAHDEFYYRLKLARSAGAGGASPQPLLRADIDGQPETVAWAWQRPDGGRSFGFSGLHFHSNWKLPEYRRLVAQGVFWTLKLPVPKEGLAVDVTPEDLKLK